jgi:hypothetical protein
MSVKTAFTSYLQTPPSVLSLHKVNALWKGTFNLRSGGWSPNWVHSARRPLTGLLYLPRVTVRMENLVE